uniref:Uncharacterized protein n=1 Tax=uncultured Armatimonadetes bacterium TaxID=157466 RepID=A0A6J4IPV7_9BACT|nr:hypothetical protein AVDCRST_MAG63-2203 [uncultured Armatimonadetes bacterium]
MYEFDIEYVLTSGQVMHGADPIKAASLEEATEIVGRLCDPHEGKGYIALPRRGRRKADAVVIVPKSSLLYCRVATAYEVEEDRLAGAAIGTSKAGGGRRAAEAITAGERGARID